MSRERKHVVLVIESRLARATGGGGLSFGVPEMDAALLAGTSRAAWLHEVA